MKQQFNISMAFLCMLFLGSCSISPVDIVYNEDQCDACKMLISDNRFGAELVTKKGKVYKYDAIECLVPELIKNGTEKYAYILVTDYEQPKSLIDATKATFLVSENLPSPMGANLSAFQSSESADKALAKNGGDLHGWDEICQHRLFVFE